MSLFKNYFKDYGKLGGMGELLKLAVPMMISTACDGVMTFTDRLLLAKVGTEQMNAALGGGLSFQLLIFFFVGLTGYSTALVAQYYGAGKNKQSPKATFQAFLIVLIAWPVILLVKPLVVALFYTVNLSAVQVAFQVKYLNVLVWGGLFSLLRHVLGCYFSGIGKTRIVMTATISALIVNVTLDYLLIFGKLGLPALGVVGAALATVAGSLSAVIILLFAYFSTWNRLKFSVMQSFGFDKRIMRKLIHFGYPNGLEFLLNFMAMFVMTILFQSKGVAEATAASIMFSWDLISFIPLTGVEIAVTSLVGRYMGAGRPQVAHRAAFSAIKVGTLFSLFMTVLFITIPNILAGIFRPDTPDIAFDQAMPLAVWMLRLASIYVICQAAMIAIIGTLRGAGDTLYTMFVSVLANWAFLPVAYLILNVFGLSLPWAWFGIILVYLVFCVAIYFRFKSEKWKKIKVI